VVEVGRLVAEALAGVEQLKKAHGLLQKELKKARAELVAGTAGTIGQESKLGRLCFWFIDFADCDRDKAAAWIDSKKGQDKPVVAAATFISGDKRLVAVGASSSAVKDLGVHAGQLLKEMLSEFGGRGGGKPSFAQGGVPMDTDAQKVLAKLTELLRERARE